MLLNPAASVDAGSRLFQDLMRGDIRDLWISARSDLEQHQVDGLRLRLALQPPAVAALPWESLYDPDRKSAFAASGRTPLVRVENLFRYVGRPRPLRASLPVKILIAAPEDPSAQIDAESEIAATQQMLKKIGAGTFLVNILSGRFSIVDLRRRIEAQQPDILHVISHGLPDGIQLWQRGRPRLVSSASMRSTLERSTSVKLVFLNACLAGVGSEEIAFTSVGSQLLQAGVPAVIAMQFSIREDAAIDFAQFLYEELVMGTCPGTIDAAVAYARSSLYSLNPGDFSFGTPILWLNAEDGLIFDLDPSPSDATLDEKDDDKPYSPPVDYVQLDEEVRWLTQLESELDLSKVPSKLKFVTWEMLDAIQTMRMLLHQLRHLEESGAKTRYAQKATMYREKKGTVLRLKRYIEEAIRLNSD